MSAILTHSGRLFDFAAPGASAIDICTIAHALSNICRFTGHTYRFYSVAQHSVLVSHLAAPEHALAGLLHDAAEAFLGDVASPLKALLPDYRAIERRVESVVLARFGLPEVLPSDVRRADLCALATEDRDLMPPHADDWPHVGVRGVQADRVTIYPLPPVDACALFMFRFRELGGVA